MKICLPSDPKDSAYEDLVTAYLLASSCFVETRIKFKSESVDVFELDVVASDATATDGRRLLVEAKSGQWGFPDVFKLYGWRTYLGIHSGAIAYRQELDQRKLKQLAEIAPKAGIGHFRVDVKNGILEPALMLGDWKTKQNAFLAAAWYSQVAQRLALSSFTTYRKSQPRTPEIETAIAYENAVEKSFFEPSPVNRVRALYGAFTQTPKITGKFVSQIAAQKKCSEIDIWNALKDSEDCLWLQYVMHLENRARLLILKGAADLIADWRTAKKAPNNTDWGELPEKFRTGTTALWDHPSWNRIPYLFQVYFEVFGGFLLAEDLSILSQIVEMPEDEIRSGLALYETFFQTEKTWTYRRCEIQQTKYIPAFLCGVGSLYRKLRLGFERYETAYPKGGWLLSKWHNALVHTCGRELEIPE